MSDAHTVRGALAASADALEAHDVDRFFNLIDERSRFAMAATVKARVAARKLIEADYPQAEQAAALAALGDAAHVDSPEALFRKRCDAACLRGFAERLGAPAEQKVSGDEVVVTTVRGTILHMHAGTDGRYGIVWKTQETSDERAQAARDLVQIRDNAAIFRRRRALEEHKSAP